MVRITNGVRTFEVTMGAYKEQFKNQGFHIVPDKKTKKETPKLEIKKAKDEPKEDVEEKVESEDEPKAEDKKEFVDEIREKPLSSWSGKEIKKFAEEKNIDISGTKSADEAREIIKEYL